MLPSHTEELQTLFFQAMRACTNSRKLNRVKLLLHTKVCGYLIQQASVEVCLIFRISQEAATEMKHHHWCDHNYVHMQLQLKQRCAVKKLFSLLIDQCNTKNCHTHQDSHIKTAISIKQSA